MQRRDFVTLLASAPIAALAPWTKVAPTNTITILRHGEWQTFQVGETIRIRLPQRYELGTMGVGSPFTVRVLD